MLYESGALTIESFRRYTASKGLRVWSLGLPGPPCRLICGCDSSFQLAAICMPPELLYRQLGHSNKGKGYAYCLKQLIPDQAIITLHDEEDPAKSVNPSGGWIAQLQVFWSRLLQPAPA